jgi:hypothetical protein
MLFESDQSDVKRRNVFVILLKDSDSFVISRDLSSNRIRHAVDQKSYEDLSSHRGYVVIVLLKEQSAFLYRCRHELTDEANL